MNRHDHQDIAPDDAFFNMLGIVFAVMITVAAAMVMVLPGEHAPDRADVSQLTPIAAATNTPR